jgi:type VI secretion system protein VasD
LIIDNNNLWKQTKIRNRAKDSGKMIRTLNGRFFTAIAIALLLTGCLGGVKAPPPTHINAEIRASDDVNPDDSGRASPIVVRIYGLKSVGTFNSSDFYTLYNDEGQLGSDLVIREEVLIRPGGQKIFAREMAPEVQYLGIVAAYRQLTKSVWKESIPVPGGRTTNFSIDLNQNSIAIQFE